MADAIGTAAPPTTPEARERLRAQNATLRRVVLGLTFVGVGAALGVVAAQLVPPRAPPARPRRRSGSSTAR